MKKIILLFFIFLNGAIFSQNLNSYQYALIPSKFLFLKEKDEYHLNTLAKLFMEKYGFESYLDTDSLPNEVLNYNCNKVYVEVLNKSTLFTTKLVVVLKDCKNTVLFTSKEGESRDKEYKVAYTQALRQAFETFGVLKSHHFEPTSKSLSVIVDPTNQEIIPTGTTIDSGQKETIPQALYAKPFGNGFQLLTNTTNIPQYLMTIYKTSTSDVFIAQKENVNGVLFRKNGNWYFEYYKEDKLVSVLISIVNF